MNDGTHFIGSQPKTAPSGKHAEYSAQKCMLNKIIFYKEKLFPDSRLHTLVIFFLLSTRHLCCYKITARLTGLSGQTES